MSEGTETTSAESGQAVGNGAVAAGALLRQAREAAGIHIGALAVGLKVPVKKLEALEAGELAILSSPVFVRALAASVCRNLKIDATEVLALLPQVTSAPLVQPNELKTPFRLPGEGHGMSQASRFLTAPVLAVVLLLVGALALALWPHKAAVEEAEHEVPATAAPAAAVESPKPADQPLTPGPALPQVTPEPTPLPSGKASVAASAVSVPSATAVPLAAAATAAASLPVSAVSAPARPASSPVIKVSAGVPAPGESSVVQFKVSSESSWIEVMDAKGDTVLRKTVDAGQVAAATGVLPLRIVVGRADVTEVTVRGKKLDMKAAAQGNVARFEVAP